jgi:hypothetical protein
VADVFISYSKVDRAIAESLANDLKARGFEVWWDFELYAGDNFQSMIRAEISKAKAVVVIWSDTAAVSEWVYGEAMLASRRGTMISAHVPGFDVHEVPINFLPLHCEPVTNRDRLISAIERKGAKASETIRKPVEIDNRKSQPAAVAGDADTKFGSDLRRDIAILNRAAVKIAQLGVKEGNASAQAKLADFYRDGKGVSQNYAEAALLYRLAADQGHASAQYELAKMCEKGEGVTRDLEAAMGLYRLAANQDHEKPRRRWHD